MDVGATSISSAAGAECASVGGVAALATAAIPAGPMWPAGVASATDVAAAGTSVGVAASVSASSTRTRSPGSLGTLPSPCSEAVGELVTSIAVVGALPVRFVGAGAVVPVVSVMATTAVMEVMEAPVAVVTAVEVWTIATVACEAEIGVGTIELLPGVLGGGDFWGFEVV